jgi:molybdopterin-containing oxidoreductase family membrane subunit
MCRLIVVTSLLISYAYLTEFFNAWYGGNPFEQYTFLNRAFGPYAWCFWTMIVCNVIAPQLFWFRRVRTTPWAMFLIAIMINIGMWFERFVIIATSLSRDYLPSSWKMFRPTWADLLQLLGSFGLFLTLFLLFIRFLPMIAMSEVKMVMPATSMRRVQQGRTQLEEARA